MAREMINDMDVEKVAGGSIVITADHSQCGLNCTTQFKVNNYDDVISYIAENYETSSEREMLKNMMNMGLLTRL